MPGEGIKRVFSTREDFRPPRLAGYVLGALLRVTIVHIDQTLTRPVCRSYSEYERMPVDLGISSYN